MGKIKKKTKLGLFILVLTSCFLIFLFFVFRPYSYQKNYQVNKYEVKESYDKKTGYYTFVIKDGKTTYPFLINHQYTKKREIINNVLEYKSDEEKCLIPEGKDFEFYPLCSDNNEVYTYNLSNVTIDNYKLKKIKSLDESYKEIKIDYLNAKNYLLFNYRGFYFLKDDEKQEISLFDKDIYNLSLVYQNNEYVLIPNYNETHYFSNFYLINMKTGNYEEIKLENKISFDSTFLGDYKNKVYLLDKKEEKEYQINLKNKKIAEVDFSILEDNKFVKKDFKDITLNNLNFLSSFYPEYKIQDNTLYEVVDNNLIKISKEEVSKIIKVEKDTVYYLAKDNLMMYNNTLGEVILLNNFEWNFNNDNMIYIF